MGREEKSYNYNRGSSPSGSAPNNNNKTYNSNRGLALRARPLNIAASSDAGAEPGKSGKGATEREEQNGRKRAYIEKTNRFRSSKLNRNSDEKEQTYVSDSRQMCTKDPTSGTKAMFVPLPTTASLAARSCANWIPTLYLQRSSTAA